MARVHFQLAAVVCLLIATGRTPFARPIHHAAAPGEMVTIQWLEPVSAARSGDLPEFKPIPSSDPRIGQAER